MGHPDASGYLIKGFVMDDERLKNPPVGAHRLRPDYFDEMLERIRDIRASERRVYFAGAGDLCFSCRLSAIA